MNTESSLLENVVVIQGEKKVHSGMVSYLEGEIFEVEFSQAALYDPGELVKVIIYTPEGMVYFDTSVIAQGSNEVMLLFPSDISSSLIRNRQFSRLLIPLEGTINSILEPSTNLVENIEFPKMNIHNISQGGVGFAYCNPISVKSAISFTIQLDGPLLFHAEIIHKSEHEDQKKIALRSWILRKQIELRFEAKKQENELEAEGENPIEN